MAVAPVSFLTALVQLEVHIRALLFQEMQVARPGGLVRRRFGLVTTRSPAPGASSPFAPLKMFFHMPSEANMVASTKTFRVAIKLATSRHAGSAPILEADALITPLGLVIRGLSAESPLAVTERHEQRGRDGGLQNLEQDLPYLHAR